MHRCFIESQWIGWDRWNRETNSWTLGSGHGQVGIFIFEPQWGSSRLGRTWPPALLLAERTPENRCDNSKGESQQKHTYPYHIRIIQNSISTWSCSSTSISIQHSYINIKTLVCSKLCCSQIQWLTTIFQNEDGKFDAYHFYTSIYKTHTCIHIQYTSIYNNI